MEFKHSSNNPSENCDEKNSPPYFMEPASPAIFQPYRADGAAASGPHESICAREFMEGFAVTFEFRHAGSGATNLAAQKFSGVIIHCCMLHQITTRFTTYDTLISRAEQRKRATVHFRLVRKARRAVKAKTRAEAVHARSRAAVLILLHERDGDVHVTLTQRNTKLRSHAGEVALPGGKRDVGDLLDDSHTAVREAHEEIGLDPQEVHVLCSLAPCVSRLLTIVTPVVAWVDSSVIDRLHPASPDEVARIFHVPLAFFLTEASHSSRDDHWNGLQFRVHDFRYSVEPAEGEGHEPMRIWGLTASILIRAAEIGLRRHAEFPIAAPESTSTRRAQREPGRGGLTVRQQVAEIHQRGAFRKAGLQDAPLPPGCCFWLFEDAPAEVARRVLELRAERERDEGDEDEGVLRKQVTELRDVEIPKAEKQLEGLRGSLQKKLKELESMKNQTKSRL